MDELIVSSGPHIHSGLTVKKIMRDTVISLIPIVMASFYFFGQRAIYIMAVSVLTSILSEKLFNKILKIKDDNNASAVITGLLFSFTLPPMIPLHIAAFGAFCGILLGKIIFGGLGTNPFNPALVGRAILFSSWPTYMTKWTWPQELVKWVKPYPFDAVTMPTPLNFVRQFGIEKLYQYFSPLSGQLYYNCLLLGNRAGSIGETSAIAILTGALFLIFRKHISLHIPLSYILTVFLLAITTGNNPLFHILSGGLLLGAFFMATDYVTSPFYGISKIIFGIGCGVLTFLIRTKGGFPEGVCYSILIMNMFTPLLNRYLRPKRYGR